ncbi:hypothetical protein NIIg32_gp65 [Parageobacillus phage vB_PtoS_NIIg3.2]|nr:hypothetical protein NIIg32_gp65 [Parageobacillus phage vB_PtoS_NIIg3.2]
MKWESVNRSFTVSVRRRFTSWPLRCGLRFTKKRHLRRCLIFFTKKLKIFIKCIEFVTHILYIISVTDTIQNDEEERTMNKREIMKKAVALAKTFIGDWVARMALALKIVWAEAKKMVKKVLPELKGTAKQVAWANDIREKAIAVLDEMAKEYASKLENGEVFSNKDDDYRAEKKANLFEAFDALLNVSEAKTWIELFGVNYAVTRKGVDHVMIARAFAEDWLKAQMKRGRLADSFIKRMASYN